MIRLSDIDPSIPRKGWPGRNRAIALLAVKVVGLTAMLIAFLVVGFVVIWLGAPEGAGWPS